MLERVGEVPGQQFLDAVDDMDAALEESELQDEQDKVIEDADANLKKHSTDSSK